MSNLSAKILRSIVAAEFTVKPEQIRISGYAHELDTKKEWWGTPDKPKVGNTLYFL